MFCVDKNLKSNMDRFIGRAVLSIFCSKCYLKSNMDRFIVKLDGYTTVPYWHLKSNMDRFIDSEGFYVGDYLQFKIQYG